MARQRCTVLSASHLTRIQLNVNYLKIIKKMRRKLARKMHVILSKISAVQDCSTRTRCSKSASRCKVTLSVQNAVRYGFGAAATAAVGRRPSIGRKCISRQKRTKNGKKNYYIRFRIIHGRAPQQETHEFITRNPSRCPR